MTGTESFTAGALCGILCGLIAYAIAKRVSPNNRKGKEDK